MNKILSVFFTAVFLLFVVSGISYSQEENQLDEIEKVGEVEKVDDMEQDLDDIEQNVNNMLKLLEELEGDDGLGEEDVKFTNEGLDSQENESVSPPNQFVKPEESVDQPGEQKTVQSQQDDPKKHIETENEVVRFVPEDPESHFRLGLDYWRSQDLDKAITHFMEVVRLAPENAHAFWNLGLLFDKKNNGRDAIAYMKKAQDIYLKYHYDSYVQESRQRLDRFYKKYNFQPDSPVAPE